MQANRRIVENGVLVSAFLLFFLIYILVLNLLFVEDLSDHARFALEIIKGERSVPGNFLLYWLVALLTLFSDNITYYEVALCLLIAGATTYKLGWTQKRIGEIGLFQSRTKKAYWFSVLTALSLIFVFVIPVPSYFVTDRFYLGNFVPNMWHNSTTIFLFPFAIILFYQSYKQLVEYKPKRNILIFILILLNVFIKPSFFFVFVCVYPLFMLIRYKFSKSFWQSLLPLLLGGLCLILEYYLIYISEKGNAMVAEESSVIISLFSSYKEYSPLRMLPLALLFSLLFPTVYYICNYRKLKKDILAWYVALSLAVALLVYFVLAESGPRAAHGNFYWQIIISVWLFYFQSLIFLLKDVKLEGFTLKNKSLTILYSIHVFMGLLFLMRMFVTRTIMDA